MDRPGIRDLLGSGTVLYYVQDQLGSTRGLTDSSGNVAASFTYNPYGQLTASTGTATTPFGFGGQYTDSESGLQYLRNRYYDPAGMQFITRDPPEKMTGTPYAYVHEDPLNRRDPTGLVDPGGNDGVGSMGGYGGFGGYELDGASEDESATGASADQTEKQHTPAPPELDDTYTSKNELIDAAEEDNTEPGDSESCISDWSGYPEGDVPIPSRPFRILKGQEYNAARDATNSVNKSLRRANPERYADKQIHEVHPVKFGGDPTDEGNKVALSPEEHRRYSAFWNRVKWSILKPGK